MIDWSARFLSALIFLGTGMASHPTLADSDTTQGGLTLELNKVANVKAGCQLTFVASNMRGGDLNEVAFEFVLFNADGLVNRLAVFNFQKMPDKSIRVRQFTVDETSCADISRILVNGVAACTGSPDGTDGCMSALKTISRGTVVIGK